MNLIRKTPRRIAVAISLGLALATSVVAAPKPAVPPGVPTGLVTLYADALDGNQTYQARLAEFRIAAELEPQAHGKLLPQVGLRGSYDYVHEDIEGTFFGVVDVENKDEFPSGLIGAQLTQALYRPELWIDRDQAKKRVTQARFALDEAEDFLLVAVATAYFASLAAEDNQRLTRAEKDAVTRQFEQIDGRFQAGLATEADFQTASAQRALVEAKLIESQTAIEVSYTALEVIVGRPARRLRVLPENVVLASPEPQRVDEWAQRAREQNQKVLAIRFGREVAELEIDKALKLRWPKLDLISRGGYLDSGGGLTGDRTELEGRIGLSLSVPIYSGGQIESAVRAAEAGEARAQALLLQAQAEAARDARISFLNCQVGLARIPALKTAVDAARAAESATQAGYEAGTQTTADLLRSVEARYKAERELAGARYKFMLDTLQLKFAAGNLANSDLARFDRLLRAPAP